MVGNNEIREDFFTITQELWVYKNKEGISWRRFSNYVWVFNV